MAEDSSIPSFLSLRNPAPRRMKARPSGTARATSQAPASQASASNQLAFHLVVPEAVEPVLVPPPTSTPREPILYTVRQLIAELRGHLESAYTGILNVEGEISNCRPAGSSGHLYFTLKDGDAQLPVVLFRRQAQLLAFKLRDGLAVEVRGRIGVYESRGQLQLIAETLRPRGTGALQLAFEQLRDRLRREGLFDRPRTPLPPFPHCIGIVTSPSGAALRDIIHVVRRRHARLNLLIYPAIMQGVQCPSSVAAGVRWFNRMSASPQNRVTQVSRLRPGNEPPHLSPDLPCVDLILVARGGGSLEDLAGFNDEALARTIVASRLPVVSAIGHEIDHTIADFVADLRAPTPSAAAELITAAQHRIEERVLSLERRVLRAGEYHLLRCRQRLQRLSASHVLARVRVSIGLREQRIDDLARRLAAAMDTRLRTRHKRLAALTARLHRHAPTVRLTAANRRLADATHRMDTLAERLIASRRQQLDRATLRLAALSPLAVLNRGYAIVYADSGVILRHAAEALPDQQIYARLGDGTIHARVTSSKEETA